MKNTKSFDVLSTHFYKPTVGATNQTKYMEMHLTELYNEFKNNQKEFDKKGAIKYLDQLRVSIIKDFENYHNISIKDAIEKGNRKLNYGLYELIIKLWRIDETKDDILQNRIYPEVEE